MCKFLSGIVLKNGDIICEPECTDSHEVLIRAAQVRDTEIGLHAGNLARFEFTPPDDLRTVSDLSTWSLRADESVIPDWWDADKVRAYCERRVSSMLVRDARGTMLGGCWIFDGENASVKEIARGRIVIAANGADLAGANLTRADLAGANLARADLTGADLADADLTRANLAGAWISEGQALPKGWRRMDSGLVVKDE